MEALYDGKRVSGLKIKAGSLYFLMLLYDISNL